MAMSAEMDREILQEMDHRIQAIKAAALDLQELSGGTQAVYRNADRILASVKILEINVSDVLDLL
jgi:hypothetical protein